MQFFVFVIVLGRLIVGGVGPFGTCSFWHRVFVIFIVLGRLSVGSSGVNLFRDLLISA